MGAPRIKQDVVVDVTGVLELQKLVTELQKGATATAAMAKAQAELNAAQAGGLPTVTQAAAKRKAATKTTRESTKALKAEARAEDKLQKERKQTEKATRAANEETKKRIRLLTGTPKRMRDAQARAQASAMRQGSGIFFAGHGGNLSNDRASIEAIQAKQAYRKAAQAGVIKGYGSFRILDIAAQRTQRNLEKAEAANAAMARHDKKVRDRLRKGARGSFGEFERRVQALHARIAWEEQIARRKQLKWAYRNQTGTGSFANLARSEWRSTPEAVAIRAQRKAWRDASYKGAGSYRNLDQTAQRIQQEIDAKRAERARLRRGVAPRGSFAAYAATERKYTGPPPFQPGDLRQVTTKLNDYKQQLKGVNEQIGRYQGMIHRGEVANKDDLMRKQQLVQAYKAQKRRILDIITPLKTERGELVKTAASTLNVRKEKRALARYEAKTERLRHQYNRTKRASIFLDIQEREAKQALRAEILKERIARSALQTSRGGSTFRRGVAHTASGVIGALAGSMRNVATSILFHATSGVGLAILGAIGALRVAFSGIIKPAAVFEKSLALVAKTTKMSKTEITAYGEELLKMSSKLAIARQELVKISMIAGQMGIRGTANLLAFTKTVAYMTRVSEIGAQKASDGIAAMSVAFNLPIAAAEHMGSVLNEMGNHSTANADKLIQAMAVVSKVAHQFGLTFAETSAISATLIEGMKSPSRAGVALRSILVDMRTRQSEISALMGMTVEAVTKELDTEPLEMLFRILSKLSGLDSQQFDKIAKDIFGKRHQQAVRILAENTEDLSKRLGIANEAFADGTSLAEEHARAMNNAASGWERLGAAIKNFFTGEGGKLNEFWQSLAISMTNIEDIPTMELLRSRGRGGSGSTFWLGGLGYAFSKHRRDKEATDEYFRRIAEEEGKVAWIDDALAQLDVAERALEAARTRHERQRVAREFGMNLDDIAEYRSMLQGGRQEAVLDTAIRLEDVDALTEMRDAFIAMGPVTATVRGNLDRINAVLADIKAREEAPFDVYADAQALEEYERILEKAAKVRASMQEDSDLARLGVERAGLIGDISEAERFRTELKEGSNAWIEITGAINTYREGLGQVNQEMAELEDYLQNVKPHLDAVTELFNAVERLQERREATMGMILPDNDDLEKALAAADAMMRIRDLMGESTKPIEELMQPDTAFDSWLELLNVRKQIAELHDRETEKGMLSLAEQEKLIELYEQETQLRKDLVNLEEERLQRIRDQAQEMADTYEGTARIFNDLVQDSVQMIDALGYMSSIGRDFARSLNTAVDAAGKLLAEIELINAAKKTGEATSMLSFLGPVGAALGIVTGIIGMIGAITRGGRRRDDRDQPDTTSVSVSRSITEIQGNALVNIGQQQVYWLRRIATGLHPAWSASDRRLLQNSGNLTAMPGPAVNIETINVEVPLDPDSHVIGQGIGQAIVTQEARYNVRKAFS